MRFRHDVLVSDKDMGTSGTVTENLDYVDPISAITLRFYATNGATDNHNNPIERNITTIEVVDGSDVLWSLPGDVAYALYSQLAGHPPMEYMTAVGSDGPELEIPILFGRQLFDPVLALNPTRFRNPQLKVTFDEATVRAASATGYSSDSFTMTVLVHLVEDGPAPQGFLMAKDIYDFTSLGSGDEIVEMPTDYPYRLLMVRAYEAGTDFRSSIDNYELNCDGGKFKPFDMSAARAFETMVAYFNPTFKGGYDELDDGMTVQTWIGFDIAQGIHGSGADYIASAGSFWPAQFTAMIVRHEGSPSNEIPCHWHCHGYAPHNTMFIPFGRLNEIAEWFNAAGYGSVKLYLGQGDADAEVNVCLQQYRQG